MDIKIIPAYHHSQEIRELFSEYTEMLISGDPAFKEYLEIQNYDAELEHLEDKYGMPAGRLYLAYCDGKTAGCIGLKKLDDDNCEMKRLYVRPEFRKQSDINTCCWILYHFLRMQSIYIKNGDFMRLAAIITVRWSPQFICDWIWMMKYYPLMEKRTGY